MIVLCEGVDNSGKSSLLKQLVQTFPGATLFDQPYRPTKYSSDFLAGVYAGLYYSLHKYPANWDSLYFLDRSHITELIYGSILRRYDANRIFNWKQYEQKLRLSTLVIYMTAPIKLLEERWHTEKEDFLPFEQIQAIQEAYKNYLAKSPLPHLCLSSVNPMQDNIVKVVKFLDKIKSQ